MTDPYATYATPLPSEYSWIERLISVVKPAVSKGLDIVIIAIARKMARLLEYFKGTSHELSKLISDNKGISIITEHAIPTALSGANCDNTEIIILDDFIVYGDTVEIVSENVYYLTGIKSKVIAMAASEDARFFSMWNEIVFPNRKSEDPIDLEAILNKSQIPAFTSRNSQHILSLCEPIDIEHTIFEIKLSEQQFKYLKKNAEKIISEIFQHATTYTIRHRNSETGEESINVTVCNDTHLNRVKNNDFNKFRFFIGQDHLSVVSYAPNIWDANDLAIERDLFVYSDLNRCWKYYKNQLSNISYNNVCIEDKTLESILRQHFEERLELGCVIWANYLKSFENALIFQDELESLASRITIIDTPGLTDVSESASSPLTINRDNLNWLLGKNLVEDIYPFLQSAREKKDADTEIFGIGVSEGDAEPLIPSVAKEQYHTDKVSYLLMCPGVDTTLSMIFYKLWLDFGLAKKNIREERVKIGETYQSLERIFSIVYKLDNRLKANLNRWIDQRIDLGIVVPKYESSNASLGRKLWRRYFRPGEREDIMVDAARLAMIVTNEYADNENVSIHEFSELLLPEIFKISNTYKGQSSLDCFIEGLFQKIKQPENNPEDFNLAYTVWTYMIILKGYELPYPDSWNVVKINQKNFETTLNGSPIYSLT